MNPTVGDSRRAAFAHRERLPPARNFSDPTTLSGPGSVRYTPPPSPREAPNISHRQPLKLHVDPSPTAGHGPPIGRPISPVPSKSTSPVSPVSSHRPPRRASSQRMRYRAASPLSQERFPEEDEPFPAVRGHNPQSRGRMRPPHLGDPAATDLHPDDEYPARAIHSSSGRARGMTATSNSSPWGQPRLLRTSTSIPDYGPIRSGQRNPTAMYNPDRGRPRQDSNVSSFRREPFRRDTDELRESVRSGFTNTSSSLLEASGTERSSVLTKSSSNSELHLSFAQAEDDDDDDEDEAPEDGEGGGMSVEDAIMMYEEGFEEDHATISYDPSDEGYASQTAMLPTPDLDKQLPALTPETASTPSLAPSSPPTSTEELAPSADSLDAEASLTRSSAQILSGRQSAFALNSSSISPTAPRDRYGFKKATQNITVEAYDDWNTQYTAYLERRRKKWDALLKHHGISTDKPDRFPPKSDKVKRYVRKGIPPDWRGAAWFWYGGGPEWLAKNKDLYWNLIEQVKQGKLTDWDKEQIERDLNRTFPDNTRFKPERGQHPRPAARASPEAAQTSHAHSASQVETPILRALRRVLQAFAIHNPGIGYCQSLNFLAGLLLLFLDEDEERAFVMLNIITTVHLPGTHSKILEANIDIGVLMGCIRESMPNIWNKINDLDDPSSNSASHSPASARLPTVSLATTSWFMSLFVGNLPIESVLRVWDSFFYEGSKTLFRIALAIFKLGEQEIRAISDPMEIFQVVQTIPRRIIDANTLMEACFKRRNGFGHISQNEIEDRRAERRRMHAEDIARINGGQGSRPVLGEKTSRGLRRAASKARMKRSQSKRR